MNQKIPPGEELYPQLGQLIYNAVPEEFSTVWVGIEMIDDVWSYEMFYQKPDGRFQYQNTDLDEVVSKFRELRNLFKQAGIEAWTGATFILSENGKFSLHYTYDDISDFGQASERREIWIKKYLGENPAIDWE